MVVTEPLMARSDDAVWVPLFVVWLISLLATAGSLFFSEVVGFPPCTLCWYQRIAMYPVVAISTVALVVRDVKVARYLWPLVLPGLAVTVYHCLLYYGVISDALTPCGTGVSCTERQLELLGFVSIPLLSFGSFLAIAGCLMWFNARVKGSAHENQ
jgi:disulfide bond formation protein DsbB